MKHQLSWNEDEFPYVSQLYRQTKQRKIRGKFSRVVLLMAETLLAGRTSQPPVSNEPILEQDAPMPSVGVDDELKAALEAFKF